jgi:hypothetical protein
MASVAILLLLAVCFPLFAETDDEVGPAEIVRRMIEQEEKNAERAAQYEYEQETVTERLNGDDEVVNTRTKTSKQRLHKVISYKVQGIKSGEDVETEVGFGSEPGKSSKEEGTYLEAMTIRELSQFYEFDREDDEEIGGLEHYVLSFHPKDEDELPKARSREEKVLAHLSGKLWVHPTDYAIVRSDSRLVSPLPFAIIDLVSLRDLSIQYEGFKHKNEVWLPKSMEVFYKVRILYLNMRRERQKVKMRDHKLAPVEQATQTVEPKPVQTKPANRANFSSSKKRNY